MHGTARLKGMPRHRDPASARSRTVRVSVRPEDQVEIQREARARGISMSAVVYQRLVAARPITALDASIALELGRIGANINQIAHRCNLGLPATLTADDLRPLVAIVRKVRLILLGGRRR